MWVWRLKQSLFGPAKAIELDSAIFELKARPTSGLPDYLLGKPDLTNTNGLQVWIIDKDELFALRRGLSMAPGNKMISRPRVSTAHGIQGTLSVGGNIAVDGTQRWCGVVMEFSPRVSRHSTDLTMITTLSEAVTNEVAGSVNHPGTNFVSVRTNLALAARIQIPNGSGVFLLNNGQDGKNEKRMGILISASQPRTKK